MFQENPIDDCFIGCLIRALSDFVRNTLMSPFLVILVPNDSGLRKPVEIIISYELCEQKYAKISGIKSFECFDNHIFNLRK